MRPRGTLGLMFAADRVQDLLRRLREDLAALIHSEIELAKTEVTEKIKTHARAAAFIAVAVVFALLAMLALLFGGIAVLALAVPLWAAALIVGGGLLLIALLIALMAMRSVRKAGMPMPEEAVAEARATVETLKEARST